MNNLELAAQILENCWRAGVRECVLCAGARNAPFVHLLSKQMDFKIYSFFEERSAGFFALGRMQATEAPVAVITTSGTAAAELLPAVIEADYQGLPLIMITADRPRRYRGSGAPQTINQIGLYSHYVDKSWDIEGSLDGRITLGRRPVHLNVCFDEPLLSGTLRKLELGETEVMARGPAEQASCPLKNPLVLVGGLPRWAREPLLATFKRWRRPLYLEAASNLRGHPLLKEWEISSLANLKYDGVIRVGSVPTARLWRDLENADVPVMNFSHLPFSGLPRERQVHNLETAFSLKAQFQPYTERAHEPSQAIHPLSESAWVGWLSRQIPAHGRVFLGNSLPIREWDEFAVRDKAHEIFCNRGVNGIDGLISTFLGVASPEHSNWAILGDLSALYDMSGPWASRIIGATDINLVVINNGGGRIFHRMFHNPMFENRHQLNFKPLAEMWNWQYIRLAEKMDLPPNQGPRLIEIVPDNAQNEAQWEQT